MIMGTSERFSARTLNLNSMFDGSFDAGNRILDDETNDEPSCIGCIILTVAKHPSRFAKTRFELALNSKPNS